MTKLLPVLMVALAALACGSSQSRSQTTTSSGRYGADAVDGQNRAPAGAATAWTTEGGPASAGVPSTGRVVEVPDEPAARDAGAW